MKTMLIFPMVNPRLDREGIRVERSSDVSLFISPAVKESSKRGGPGAQGAAGS